MPQSPAAAGEEGAALWRAWGWNRRSPPCPMHVRAARDHAAQLARADVPLVGKPGRWRRPSPKGRLSALGKVV